MDLNRYADRDKYRLASVALWVAAICPAMIVDALHFPTWVIYVFIAWGVGPFVLLTIITYKRLKDAGLWGGLIVLMILRINFGPVFYQSIHDGITITFTLGSILGTVPMAIGWFWLRRASTSAVEIDPS